MLAVNCDSTSSDSDEEILATSPPESGSAETEPRQLLHLLCLNLPVVLKDAVLQIFFYSELKKETIE